MLIPLSIHGSGSSKKSMFQEMWTPLPCWTKTSSLLMNDVLVSRWLHRKKVNVSFLRNLPSLQPTHRHIIRAWAYVPFRDFLGFNNFDKIFVEKTKKIKVHCNYSSLVYSLKSSIYVTTEDFLWGQKKLFCFLKFFLPKSVGLVTNFCNPSSKKGGEVWIDNMSGYDVSRFWRN